MRTRRHRYLRRMVRGEGKLNDTHSVSIMIPTYNRPVMFEKTLISALTQDYENFEVIVCDNSTNDDTENLIQKYIGNEHLRYYRNRDAKTKVENFMPFEKLAKGEYLQWLMDDDIIMRQKLSLMIKCFIDNPKVTLVTSQRGVIDADDKIIGLYPAPFPIVEPYSIYPSEFITWITLKDALNFIGEPSAVLFRRNDLTHHYWRAESKGLVTISDIAMWLELLERGNIAIFNQPLSYYRRHADQEGQQFDVVLRSRIEWDILNRDYLDRKVYTYDVNDYRQFLRRIVDEYNRMFGDKNIIDGTETWYEYKSFIDSAQEFLKKGE